jgi:hypothetical protein
MISMVKSHECVEIIKVINNEKITISKSLAWFFIKMEADSERFGSDRVLQKYSNLLVFKFNLDQNLLVLQK